jgi:hypothetical protein
VSGDFDSLIRPLDTGGGRRVSHPRTSLRSRVDECRKI